MKDFFKRLKGRKLLGLGFIFLLTISLYVYRVKFGTSGKNLMVLTKDGFYPAGIKIQKGETIAFKTKIDKHFWPASDIHPSHKVYPEFDPKRAISPNATWELTFNQVGTWRFHDHLDPRFRGTIEVVEKNILTGGVRDEERASKECKKLEGLEQDKCWRNYLQNTVIEDGIEDALSLLERLRRAEPSFAAQCHTFTHSIGEVSYWKYAEDKKLPKTGKIAICGYGFHHGFMQELGHHDLNFLEDAKGVCDYFETEVNYQGQERTVDPIDQCYHGIGHGIAFRYAPDFWEDEETIIRKGVTDCQNLTGNTNLVNNCVYGLFGGLTGLYTGGHGYKMPMDEEDPFWLCREQPGNLKEACYDSLVPSLWVLTEHNLSRMLAYFEKVDDSVYLQQAMYNFGDIISPRVVIGEVANEEVVATCHSLVDNLNLRCIKGFSEGLIRNGFPESAPQDALKFCSLSTLTKEEKNVCFQAFLSEIKLAYSEERITEICNRLDDVYKKYCN